MSTILKMVWTKSSFFPVDFIIWDIVRYLLRCLVNYCSHWILFASVCMICVLPLMNGWCGHQKLAAVQVDKPFVTDVICANNYTGQNVINRELQRIIYRKPHPYSKPSINYDVQLANHDQPTPNIRQTNWFNFSSIKCINTQFDETNKIHTYNASKTGVDIDNSKLFLTINEKFPNKWIHGWNLKENIGRIPRIISRDEMCEYNAKEFKTETQKDRVSLQNRGRMEMMSLISQYSRKPLQFKSPKKTLKTTQKPWINKHTRRVSNKIDTIINSTQPVHMALNDYGYPVRMDRGRVAVFNRNQHLFIPSQQTKPAQSIKDRSHSLAKTKELESEQWKREQDYPILSFQYVEPHTIELLVVVTERMRQQFGSLINDYLLSTMTTVASLLRHPSLKTSIHLSIVDIILLDPVYANRHQLEDWSNSKQEQVMARFCRWVNRLRSPTFNWDSALLLNVGHFKSTALGVAHYRSMCTTESACLAVLDRGFGTGHIIAHELGHQLGAKHDFELNSDCGLEEQLHSNALQLGTYQSNSADDTEHQQAHWNPDFGDDMVRRDTIMSGTLYFDNFPLRWSACSRQAIHAFLDSGNAGCLRRHNLSTALFPVDRLIQQLEHNQPGRIFSLDQQCEFILKTRGTQFCGQMLMPCRQLYCQDGENRACLPMEAAWAEGTPCDENKWCIQGHCVANTSIPIRIHGGWGGWGPWSSCSRTCGGGVQFSERECTNPEPQNGGDFCRGTRTRMRSCSITPCEKQTDVRQQLCDFITRPYENQLRAYFPKLGEATACNLICLDNGRAVPHGYTLPDGTRCYSHRDDICIKGKCWETGCDGILGSSQRFDRCRVCGGDNSTCDEIRGVYNGSAATNPGLHQRGLITAVRIPRGVTNVHVRKISRRSTPFSSDSYDDFMLLIFEELKTQIRRGETMEPFAGAELYYSGSRGVEEIVSITGRLQKEVNIVVRVENSQTSQPLPIVEYSYHVDKAERNNPLYFIAEEEARLAEDRSNRRQGRSYASQPTKEESISTSSPSEPETRETERGRKPGDRPKIHFIWKISDLPNGCSTCAGNVTSHPECYPLIAEDSERKRFAGFDFKRPVADYLCSATPRPPPVFRLCADYCGMRWTQKLISDSDKRQRNTCSARCGEGQQPVINVCEEFVIPAGQKKKSKGIWRPAQLGERACQKAGLGSAASLPNYIKCQGSCQPVYWVASNWTDCSSDCGNGQKYRTIRCRDKTDIYWPLKECSLSAESPSQSQISGDVISPHLAETVIRDYANDERKLDEIREQTEIRQSSECFASSGCKGMIEWSNSDWSVCEPLETEMQSYCRSLGLQDENINQLVNPLVGVRQRTVSCQSTSKHIPAGLQSYVTSTNNKFNNVPTNVNLSVDLCRKASVLGELDAEPVSREACDKPLCYRWGEAQMSQCSVTCDSGIRTAKVPCERITMRLKQSTPDRFTAPEYRIESVDIELCHRNLKYVPRIFLSNDNQTVLVETAERPIHEPKTILLDIYDLNESIHLQCNQEPCKRKVPAWHTTSWSSCSVTCGPGVRHRKALCVLETRDRKSDSIVQGHSKQFNEYASIFTATRTDTVLTDAQVCEKARLPKPTEEETCLEAPCPIWITEPWQKCEGTCHYGVQRRNVKCVVDLASTSQSSKTSTSSQLTSLKILYHNSDSVSLIRRSRAADFVQVDSERCRDAGPKPIEERICLIANGCPYWHTEDWLQCSVECGEGLRKRHVDCRFPNGTIIYDAPTHPIESEVNYRDQYISEIELLARKIRRSGILNPKCQLPRPLEIASCKARPCTGTQTFWWPVMVSKCNVANCEMGSRNRMIRCISPMLGPVNEMACSHLQKPPEWVPCAPFKCKRFSWIEDSWSSCPHECGPRMRYRNVRCVDDLGEEYSDSLCDEHLKPSNWRLCPDRCTTTPKSCQDIKRRHPTAVDGTYQLVIERSTVSIYCADMDTPNPSEYITLRQTNYAKASAFLHPPSDPNWCPYSPKVQSTSPKNDEPHLIDSSEDPREEHQEVNTQNCPDCPVISHLSVSTYFQKIRLNIDSLEVKLDDIRFAYTIGSSAMPFGTAKDCFGSTKCPQGQFRIDLRGTDFKVNTRTHWATTEKQSAAHIYRLENNQVIQGYCGGDCTGCWPRPGLLLELIDNEGK